MDTFEPPQVITAISDPDFEGLVSSALFSQGWSVIARALDFRQLQKVLAEQEGRKLLILFSTDLPGANSLELIDLAKNEALFFGFADELGNDRGFSNIFPRPKSPEELLFVILENIRTTSHRKPLIHSLVNISARVISVGGVRHSTGSTTFAINLAQEIALLGARTLLIDANFFAPAIATYLDIRHLAVDSRWREVVPNFSAMELTREKIEHFDQIISEAGNSFDEIVIDLGSVTYLARELSDRRWSSRMKIWASRNTDDFCVISNSDLLSQRCSEEFMQSARKLSLSSRLHLIKVQPSFKESSKAQISDKKVQGSESLWILPWDFRACHSATAERATLVQVGERGALRKEIVAIAKVLGSKSRK